MAEHEISVDLVTGPPGEDRASVTVFCGIQKILGKRYPGRVVDQAAMNNLIRLIAELENAYRLLPVVAAGPEAPHG